MLFWKLDLFVSVLKKFNISQQMEGWLQDSKNRGGKKKTFYAKFKWRSHDIVGWFMSSLKRKMVAMELEIVQNGEGKSG